MKDRIVVIGASLNGIDALRRLAAALPGDFPAPVLVTQHVGSHGPGFLPEILSAAGPLPAVHPHTTDALVPGRIDVAPPDRHLLVQRGRVVLSHGPHENFTRPAVDPLFRSAALAYGAAVIGVVLTGQLDDGTAGLLAIKDRHGTTIVQDPEEATAPSMPRSALRHVQVDHRLRIADIARLLVELARDDPSDPPPEGDDGLLAIENRIASGIFNVEDWWGLEQRSVVSGLNCPHCRSALYEIRDSRVLRFRCRSGHAYSAHSLLSAQADGHELQLSTLFGLAIEEATLARPMSGLSESLEDATIGAHLRSRIEMLRCEPPGIARCVTSERQISRSARRDAVSALRHFR